ncbi:MAG TPA: crosslink repair DNA glycosylase YcaQ family protein [Kofleriaceae bacterium]|nr:crosslink repair DNA glycosylase YcaQ family protein [Kofleriaceae bacterium]
MKASRSLGASEARRIALAAQGLAGARPARPGPAALRRMFERLQVVQLDSVNVVARAHELLLFARLGAHPRELLAGAIARRELFEYWGHEASLCVVELQPWLRWRMEAARRGEHVWPQVRAMLRRGRGFCDEVLAQIRARGPLSAGELEGGGRRPRSGWWEWSEGKIAVESLFWAGELTATRRAGSFERVYDLPERVLPAAVLAAPTPSVEEAHRELLRRAARALGVATAADLAAYFHLKARAARPRVAELVEAGAIVPVEVEGWDAPAYLDPAAVVPRAAGGAVLMSPFDSLVWDRDRAHRVFDFHYRIEIYTPAPKRRFGYYVLPFLLGDRLVARVDLKADRAAGVLRVQGAFPEAHTPAATVAPALAAELRALAGWLGLATIAVGPRGPLARLLRAALR